MKNLIIAVVLFGSVLGLDQWAKWLAATRMSLGERIDVFSWIRSVAPP